MSDYYHNIEEELSMGMVRSDRLLKHVQHQRSCIEELEAKLAKAVDFIEDLLSGRDRDDDWRIEARTTLAAVAEPPKLKGQDDE